MEDYYERVDSYEDDPGLKDQRTLRAAALERPLRSLKLREALCLEQSRPTLDAIQLMRKHKMGSVLITRDGVLSGIFTERDVLNQLALGEKDTARVPLQEVMRADPEVLSPEAPMTYALNLMSVGGFRHVPLVDDKRRPVAVVSVRDIVNYLVDHFPDKVLNVPPLTDGQFPGSREGA